MPMPTISAAEIARTHKAMRDNDNNTTRAAQALGIGRSTLYHRLLRHPMVAQRFTIDPLTGKVTGLETPEPTKSKVTYSDPPAGVQSYNVYAEPAKTRVVVMTSAQDNTPLFDKAFDNLQAYAAHRGGDLIIGGFTYQKALFEDNRVKAGHFAQRVMPLLRPEVVELAPRLVWYGDANILPTAVDPLTGWETNTRDKWAVLPHAKIALRCVPVMPGRPGKQIMTSGVITKPNYIQRNAGQKAEFHHTPGATIAEIKADGTFFLRQIGMAKDGSFQDLDWQVHDGQVTSGHHVEAITWGDIHYEEMDLDVAKVLWGWGGGETCMLDELLPRHQFFHDSFSFKARSHHTRRDPHQRAQLFEEGGTSEFIDVMLEATANFLNGTRRPWCRSIHVPSNHNNHLHSWLKDPEVQMDAANAKVWHQLNAAWFEAIEEGAGLEFNAHAYALEHHGAKEITFLHQGQSYLICQDTVPIECGLHGDVGPRGSKGTPTGLAKIVERVNSAHTHEPQIRDGLYVAGTSSRLNLPYASKGPGAWHHAEIVTYPNGKRTIVTLSNGAYRA